MGITNLYRTFIILSLGIVVYSKSLGDSEQASQDGSRKKRAISNILDLMSDSDTYYGHQPSYQSAYQQGAYPQVYSPYTSQSHAYAGYPQYGVTNQDARMGYRKKQPKVVHITDCHDDHDDDCHAHDDQHVISFGKHDDYYDDHGDYHDYHGYDDYHGDYHDDHGGYGYDYHDDHGDYHDHDYDHDYGHNGGGKGYSVKKPKVVIIKKIISQSTTTVPV